MTNNLYNDLILEYFNSRYSFFLRDKKLINLYPYGSRVYKTNNELSDFDFIAVVDNLQKFNQLDSLAQDCRNFNATFYSIEQFQSLLYEHEISALECYYLPDNLKILEEHIFNLSIDPNKLRDSISKKSSNSWVKAKKKMIIEKDFDMRVAKKSLFHSIRILDYAIQIISTGELYDYQSCNILWNTINNNSSTNWGDYKSKWQDFYNKLRSEFRLLTEKDKKWKNI